MSERAKDTIARGGLIIALVGSALSISGLIFSAGVEHARINALERTDARLEAQIDGKLEHLQNDINDIKRHLMMRSTP